MGSVILDTYKTVATEMKYNFKYMNYVPIVVATDLEVHFSVLKKGVPILLSILCMYKSLVFGDEFLSQGLHLQSHQRC